MTDCLVLLGQTVYDRLTGTVMRGTVGQTVWYCYDRLSDTARTGCLVLLGQAV